jgi:hypothetical protein
MKVIKLLTGLILIVFLLTGCTSFNKMFKSPIAAKEARSKLRIENVETQIVKNDKDKLKEISTLSEGTDYVLKKANEPSKEVEVAKDLNSRVMSLAGAPGLKDKNAMHAMIDHLVSELENEKKQGKLELAEKDRKIVELQLKTGELSEQKNSEIKKYMDLATTTAKKADEYKGIVDTVNSWFGLGGIWYGAKRFIYSSLIILIIFTAVFLVLRGFANTNPIAKAIFVIFDHIGSWFVHGIKTLAPGSPKLANFVPSNLFNLYKRSLLKIVDVIQTLREKEVSDKKYTLEELLSEVDKSLDSTEKDVIQSLKRELHWK